MIEFHLEDGRHETPGPSLSFGLPGRFEYECRRLAFRQQRRDREIEIVLVAAAELEGRELTMCRMVKEPAPREERVLLPAEPGSYRITFVSGARRDSYTIVVATDALELEPVATPAFTRCEQGGKLGRVDRRWLWVDLSFLSDDSLRKMVPKRDELLRALEALGAKAFVPPPGRYILDGFVREIPAVRRPGRDFDEEHFFLWDGDWAALDVLARRYQSWAHVDPKHLKRPVMTLWFSSRDKVLSTYGMW
jgi:hypothetical protein